MYKFFNSTTNETIEIPVEKIKLSFRDPDTNEMRHVPVMEIIVGDLDYKTINKHPYVYDRQNGYISIGGEQDIMVQRLEQKQIEVIEAALKIKAENIKKENSKETVKAADSKTVSAQNSSSTGSSSSSAASNSSFSTTKS